MSAKKVVTNEASVSGATVATHVTDIVLRVAAFKNPVQEEDKLHELYDSLVEARRSIGEDALPFHKFAELVKNQVKKLKQTGSPEVAFRVAVKDGKVSFTARALKGVTEE